MKILRLILVAFFVVAGAAHLISPAPYLAIIPPIFPWPETLVYLSGIAEIAGGIGLLFPRTRRSAALGLMLLLVAIFPANVYAALHGMQLAGRAVPSWMLWARLPLQGLLIAWVYFASWKDAERPR